MDEMAQEEFMHNLAMLERVQRENPSWTPCQIYYRMKKGIPLQVFKRVYSFDDLVVGCDFKLEDLLILQELYQETFEELKRKIEIKQQLQNPGGVQQQIGEEQQRFGGRKNKKYKLTIMSKKSKLRSKYRSKTRNKK